MRKESATIRKCHSRLSSLGLDSTVAFHKSKLILKIYRDVVWVLSERAQELQEYAWELGDQDLSTGLCYLENFAPDIDLQDFGEGLLRYPKPNAGRCNQSCITTPEAVSRSRRVVL